MRPGRFSDAKDPGRMAGKGWMKLEFDRLIFPDTDIPISAKVIAVRRFRVDEERKILGQGHPKCDVFAWMLPILWPIDLIRLPARGPRPTLSGEVPIVLRLMDDVDIPCTSYPSCRGASPATFQIRPSNWRGAKAPPRRPALPATAIQDRTT